MESPLEVRQLRTFVALVEQGSVTTAAQTLGLAQSTVSEALSSLERAVGAAVFLRRRGAHEITLTAAGEALLPHARAVLATIDAAHIAVAGATTGARSRVAIATNESLSSYVLARPLSVIRSAWPNTTFEVSVMVCNAVRKGVEGGDYDFGLLLQPIDDDSVSPLVDHTVVAADVPLVIFAQPSHPLTKGARSAVVRRDALSPYSLFLTDAAGDFHALVRRFLDEDSLPGPRLQSTGSVESVKRSVLGDARALGMLPAYALSEELRTGMVVAITVTPSAPRMRMDAILPRTRAHHPAALQLLAAVCSIDPRPDT
ncbi:MAG: LysR family transcriptional regulator [bacterium]